MKIVFKCFNSRTRIRSFEHYIGDIEETLCAFLAFIPFPKKAEFEIRQIAICGLKPGVSSSKNSALHSRLLDLTTV